MQAIFGYLSPLIVSTITYYLPFEDHSTKFAVGMAINEIIRKFSSGLLSFLTFLKPKKKNMNYIALDEHYEKFYHMMLYITKEYSKDVKTLIATPQGRFYVSAFNDDKIEITFEKLKFYISFDLLTPDGKVILSTNSNQDVMRKIIYFSSLSSSSDIQRFVTKEIMDKTLVPTGENHGRGVSIRRINAVNLLGNGSKWKYDRNGINKTISTTVISKQVEKHLVKDLETFLSSKEKYEKRGLCFKRSYLLHGEPGTGKTSIIKALALKYNLDIFMVDLSMVKNNDELLQCIEAIETESSYILLFEDLDRTAMFSNPEKSTITQDCLLNILDGVGEARNRITFMTTNNLAVITAFPALSRFGRIDVRVHITYCTHDQICRLLNMFYEDDINEDSLILKEITITPAVLFQLMMLYKSPKEVVNFVDKKLDFRNYDPYEDHLC